MGLFFIAHKRTLQNPAYKTSQREKPIKWTVDSSLSAMLTSMSYKGSPLPPCKWCARRSASLSHSPSWRSSRSHSPHVETPCHHSASRSRTHPSSQHSLRPLQGTAPRPRGPRCASRAAPASSTLPTTLSSCDGRPMEQHMHMPAGARPHGPSDPRPRTPCPRPVT